MSSIRHNSFLPTHAPKKVAITDTTNRIAQRVNELVTILPDEKPTPRPAMLSRGTVTVKITSAASGGGKYNGRVWIDPASDVSASGNLSASELGTDPGSDNALVLNAEEEGQSTHDLTTGTPKATKFIGRVLRMQADGKYLVQINGVDWKDCT